MESAAMNVPLLFGENFRDAREMAQLMEKILR